VVIGATGNVGSVVADALLAHGKPVRVVGRDAARLKRFTERGAEAAAGSIGEPHFTRSAIAGASAVFVMVPPSIDPGYREFQLRAAAALEGAIDAAPRRARPHHARGHRRDCQAIGKPDLRYVALPYADALQGMIAAGLPEDIAALYVELARSLNDGVLRPSQPRSPATTTPTSIEWFAENVIAPAFRGTAPR
jgi:uncharacterized protein YbjT (DUF2867 family)